MLKVVPKFWSYAFSVIDGAECVAQTANLSWWRDKAELRVRGTPYTTRRYKSSYILESADGVLVRAEQPRRLFREFIIEHSGRRYTLRAKSMFRRTFLLFEGVGKDSTQIGSIAPAGLFTRKATVDLPKTLPLLLQIFIIWVAMTIWKHDDAADGASAGAAAAPE